MGCVQMHLGSLLGPNKPFGPPPHYFGPYLGQLGRREPNGPAFWDADP